MRLFVDTANVDEIRTAASWGVIDGVTTNPSLVAREGRDFKEVIMEIARIVDGPLSAEVVSLDSEGMVSEAEHLASWHPNIVVKIPMTPEGVRATAQLSRKGIRTNVTLCFSANQALLAAKAGATFASIFLGRLDDAGSDGMEPVRQAVEIFDHYAFDTQIIAASIRHPMHVLEAARAGCHVATVPFKVLEQCFRHPLTDIGIERFLADWQKVPRK